MQIDMKEDKHLCIGLGRPSEEDDREVIIDKEQNDIRVCDGHHVIKVRFIKNRMIDVLVDDILVWNGWSGQK